MARYKLTPLEELRLEKRRLREERDLTEQRLSYQMHYLAHNWGSLIVNEVSSSVRSRMSDFVNSVFSETNHSDSPFFTKTTNPWLSLVVSNLPLLSGFIWKMAKPAILAFLLKKATSMLFRRRKKK